MTDATNVIELAARRQPAPFQYIEFRLRQDGSLQATACDADGDLVVFEYKLASPTTARDLERLLAGWNVWRGSSTVAG